MKDRGPILSLCCGHCHSCQSYKRTELIEISLKRKTEGIWFILLQSSTDKWLSHKEVGRTTKKNLMVPFYNCCKTLEIIKWLCLPLYFQYNKRRKERKKAFSLLYRKSMGKTKNLVYECRQQVPAYQAYCTTSGKGTSIWWVPNNKRVSARLGSWWDLKTGMEAEWMRMNLWGSLLERLRNERERRLITLCMHLCVCRTWRPFMVTAWNLLDASNNTVKKVWRGTTETEVLH